MTDEQESWMERMRNHKGVHRMYERSRVNCRARNWEYHITCRTGKPFVAQPHAEAPTSAERKWLKTNSRIPPTFQLVRDPDKDIHILVPGEKRTVTRSKIYQCCKNETSKVRKIFQLKEHNIPYK